MSTNPQVVVRNVDHLLYDLLDAHHHVNPKHGLLIPKALFELLTGQTIESTQGLLTAEHVAKVMFDREKTSFQVIWETAHKCMRASDTRLWGRMSRDSSQHLLETGHELQLLVYADLDMAWVGVGYIYEELGQPNHHAKLWVLNRDGTQSMTWLIRDPDTGVIAPRAELSLMSLL